MKSKTFLVFLLIVFMIGGISIPVPVQAQTPPAYVFDTTMPVDSFVRRSVDAWLAVSPPANATYFAITYAQSQNLSTIVSLAALDLTSPDQEWHLTEDANGNGQLIWLGTVRVDDDGSVHLLTDPQAAARPLKVLALPHVLAGGGSNVRFPWQPGRSVMYGPRAVHTADYGQASMVAVDFVSGSNMGSSAASSAIFASLAGTIDYICKDSTSVAIRTNGPGLEPFLYAHLRDNATLIYSHDFNQGDMIGNVVSASFDDSCGWADQQDNHYHLHMGMMPAGGVYRMGGCVLSISTEKWTCGTKVISAGQYITNTGGGGIGTDDGGTTATPSFWTMLLVGVVSIFDQGLIKLLPEHTSPSAVPMAMFSALRFVFRVTFVLLKANFNMGPAMAAFFTAFAFRLLIGAVWLVAVIFRIIKILPGL